MTERILTLERRLRRTQFILVILASTLVAFVALAARHSLSLAASADDKILHLRGLVIEDAEGHPRLLLGVPTPEVAGRKRKEAVTGIVLLGPNGADRVVIAYPGIEPQVMGKVEKRSVAVASAGLLINDADGNERAGFGVSDDGSRISLGLDYADRDALGLLVSPGFSGLAVFARDGERNDQITAGVGKHGESTFKLADSNGDEHLMIEAKRGSRRAYCCSIRPRTSWRT